jgi:hydrogenase nickel incorporation protein HypA/HybF
MHELSVTQSVLSIALEHAQKAGAQRITQIVVVIGDFSTFVDDSVQFYFDIISQGTIAEGAELIFDRTPGRLRCGDCGSTFTYDARRVELTCPSCGGSRLEIVGGREFYVESIGVEP